ncbi:MAG: sirohydrochlorin cobaltochelatase [Desulfobacterales bacterium]
MKIPIVMAAFGTATKAMNTYAFINSVCKERFPDYPLFWAFSSRMVKDRSRQKYSSNLQHPHQVLEKLHRDGHQWAVVQSLHLMCGHEFYRLIEEVKSCSVRTSLGLPLLTCPEDYLAAVNIFKQSFSRAQEEAIVLVGHGTDHPSWCAYVALDHVFRENTDAGFYVGVVEKNGYPSRESVIRNIKEAGYRKVRMIPFMLVAGMHFKQDLIGNEDSWQSCFEKEGIMVKVETQGLGFHREIVELYCRHIENALDVIPLNKTEHSEISKSGIL